MAFGLTPGLCGNASPRLFERRYYGFYGRKRLDHMNAIGRLERLAHLIFLQGSRGLEERGVNLSFPNDTEVASTHRGDLVLTYLSSNVFKGFPTNDSGIDEACAVHGPSALGRGRIGGNPDDDLTDMNLPPRQRCLRGLKALTQVRFARGALELLLEEYLRQNFAASCRKPRTYIGSLIKPGRNSLLSQASLPDKRLELGIQCLRASGASRGELNQVRAPKFGVPYLRDHIGITAAVC